MIGDHVWIVVVQLGPTLTYSEGGYYTYEHVLNRVDELRKRGRTASACRIEMLDWKEASHVERV